MNTRIIYTCTCFTWPGSVWTSARTRWNMLFLSSRRSSAQYRFFTRKVRQLWRKPLLGGGGGGEELIFHSHQLNPYNAALSLNKSWRPKGFFQFEIIVNVLVISFRFIWIPMLRVYSCYRYIFFSLRGRSFYVRIWRLHTSDSDVWRYYILNFLTAFLPFWTQFIA